MIQVLYPEVEFLYGSNSILKAGVNYDVKEIKGHGILNYSLIIIYYYNTNLHFYRNVSVNLHLDLLLLLAVPTRTMTERRSSIGLPLRVEKL